MRPKARINPGRRNIADRLFDDDFLYLQLTIRRFERIFERWFEEPQIMFVVLSIKRRRLHVPKMFTLEELQSENVDLYFLLNLND